MAYYVSLSQLCHVWCIYMLCCLAGGSRSSPKSDASAVVFANHARFTVLTPQLIRMEWDSDSKFRDAETMTVRNRLLSVPEFTVHHNSSWLVLTTSHLQLTYMTSSKRSFYSGNLRVALIDSNINVEWKPGSRADDDEGRLPGTLRTLDGINGALELDCAFQTDRDDLHCTMGLISRSGFVVLDDTSTVEFDESPWPWVKTDSREAPPPEQCNMDISERRPCGPRPLTQAECEALGCCHDELMSSCFYGLIASQDVYFFGHGQAYKQALKDFTRISGPVPMPPRFAFGIFFSRYWAFNDVGVENVVQAYEQHAVPLDVVVVDMDWHKTFYGENTVDQAGQRKGWTGFTWDKLLFPDPEQFLARLHALGLRATLNLHPASGVQPWEDSYATVAELMGMDPASQRYVPMRMTDKRFVEVWLNHTLGRREAEGVDFWWLDWQQGEAWIEVLEHVANLNPTLWLNHVFFSNPKRWGGGKERPLILHRWGGLGNHRYPLGFSGDAVPSWASLRFQPFFTAMAANVAYGYWSHDLGGHTAETEAELFTRWIQWGAFSPVFRTHCTKDPRIRRLIWEYEPRYADIMWNAIALRASLLPYIYTEAWRTHVTGLSLVRGLYFDFPDLEAAYAFSQSQYMFGGSLMVAPITSPVDPSTGLASQTVWIPPGAWVDVTAGTLLHGPRVVSISYLEREIPLFAPAGAVIPMRGNDGSKGGVLGRAQEIPRTIRLWVMPGASKGSGELYEDDGVSEAYTGGEHAVYAFRYTYSKDQRLLTFAIKPPAPDRTYHGMPAARQYEVELWLSWPAAHVWINGDEVPQRPSPHTGTGFAGPERQLERRGRRERGGAKEAEWHEAEWWYDAQRLALVVGTGPKSAREEVLVEVEVAGDKDDALLLGGFVGARARLQDAKEMLDEEFTAGVYTDAFPTLLAAASAASRIQSDLESTAEELSWFGGVCAVGMEEVMAVPQLRREVKQRIRAMHPCGAPRGEVVGSEAE